MTQRAREAVAIDRETREMANWGDLQALQFMATYAPLRERARWESLFASELEDWEGRFGKVYARIDARRAGAGGT